MYIKTALSSSWFRVLIPILNVELYTILKNKFDKSILVATLLGIINEFSHYNQN